jgi:hypothetical protein
MVEIDSIEIGEKCAASDPPLKVTRPDFHGINFILVISIQSWCNWWGREMRISRSAANRFYFVPENQRQEIAALRTKWLFHDTCLQFDDRGD